VVGEDNALTTWEHVDRQTEALHNGTCATWLGKIAPNHMGHVVRVAHSINM